jgi:hypothetical protein
MHSKCGRNNITAGVRAHYGDRSYTIGFGYDATTKAPIPAGTCPTTRTFKLDWTGKDGTAKSEIITN